MSISKFSYRLETTLYGKSLTEFEIIQIREDEKTAHIARTLIHSGMDEYDKNRGIKKKTSKDGRL